jgi:serine/threonine protein kinase
VKIGDLGMARQVLPPPPPACSLASQDLAHAGLSSASGSSGSAGRHYCPQQQLLPASSGPATPKASAARTFTPGVVGTITYTAPEVLGVMDELQQREAQDSVETVLKVRGRLS